MSRPYLNSSIADLEALFSEFEMNEGVLVALSAELAHRETQRARILARRVDAALAAFERKEAVAMGASRSAAGSTRQAEPGNVVDLAARRNKESIDMHGDTIRVMQDALDMTEGVSNDRTDGRAELDPEEQARIEGLFGSLRTRLLDLTRRNPMLNFSLSPRRKRHLQFVDTGLQEVLDRLSSDTASLDVLPLPEPDETPADERTEEFQSALAHAKVSDIEYLTRLEAIDSLGRDDEFEIAKLDRWLADKLRESLGMKKRPSLKELDIYEHARRHGIEPDAALPLALETRSRTAAKLQTMVFPDDLESRLQKVAAEARLSEQEMGLSTLFLAIGFLEWYESDNSDKANYAPLLLLPVRLEERKVQGRSVFSVCGSADALETNVTLEKYVEQFSRSLPTFDGEGEDEVSIKDHFERVTKAVEGLKRWRVRPFLVLGHFAFGRLAMYEDLNPERWGLHPAGHPLVAPILNGSETRGDGSSLVSPPDYPVDDPEIEKIAPVLIHDADGSQHSAVIDVMKGKNLVVQGPPGTGKSQTITNIIANALADGKSVLFLAEKLAALEVVKRRLDMVGLGEFCLELHSNKTSPRSVIDSLKTRAQMTSASRAPVALDVATWSSARQMTAAYLDALHRPEDDGASPFDLMWKGIARAAKVEALPGGAGLRAALERAGLPEDALAAPATALARTNLVGIFAGIARDFERDFGRYWESPWFAHSEISAELGDIAQLLEALDEARRIACDLAAAFAGARDFRLSCVGDIETTASLVESLPSRPDFSLLAEIRAHGDAGAIDAAHRLHCALVESEAGSLHGDIVRPLSGADLEAIASLSSAASDAELRRLNPAQAAERAAAERIEVQASLRAFATLQEIAGLLSLGDADASLAPALSQACAGVGRIVDTVSVDLEHFLGFAASTEPQAFRALQKTHSELAATDKELRGLISGFSPAQAPTSLSLRAAADFLSKGFLSRFFGGFSEKGREARQSCVTLGLDPSQAQTPSLLTRLADHLDALSRFERSPDHQRLVGDAWAAMETPFAKLEPALVAREALEKALEGETGATLVRNAIFASDARELVRLAGFGPAAGAITKDDLARAPAAGPLSVCRQTLMARETMLERVITRSAVPALHALRLPIDELASAAAHEATRRALVDALGRHPAAPFVARHVRDPSDSARLACALDFARAVEATSADARMKDDLCDETRLAALVAVLAQCRPLARGLDAARVGLGLRYRIHVEVAARDPRDIKAELPSLIRAGDQLHTYLYLWGQRKDLIEKGFGEVLQIFETQRLDAFESWSELVDYAFVVKRAARARRSSPALASASGAHLSQLRSTFAAQDRIKLDKDRQEIVGKLLGSARGRISRGNGQGPIRNWTEMALLENEFRKQRRLLPVRTLLSRAPRTITALKPCFMMSPLSLAKYLPRETMTFDILVIDEASQMKPEDALGGFLRARQVVVVGDDQQLPPTDFFNRSSEVAEDEEHEDVDAESILEGCQKSFRTVRRLRWHYRSRCESLIAFSNREFYEDDLITFPQAAPDSFSIDLVPVKGAYKRSMNPIEAQQLAEEAIAFMRHHAEMPEGEVPSIGIVAINTAQRDLLAEELRRLETGDELVELYRLKVARRGEDVFVKNLENVQGDERDFIFVSMTYGPEAGRTQVMQRFGPIAGKQGHRRLNVLFTRARSRIVLFASLGSEDVRPSETSSRGVHVLKRYLAYAEARGRSLGTATGRDADSDFEIEVARRLEAHGFIVDKQVGVSGFRIDLGVRHPELPGTYLAGIECDGAAFHSSKSARDRDRLRESVLRGLGWDLLRVWSTDWFQSPDLQTTRLVNALEALRSRPRTAFASYKVMGATTARPGNHDLANEEPEGSPAEPPKAQADDDHADLGIVVDEARDTDDPPRPLTREQTQNLLERLRDRIDAEISDPEPQSSILRPQMIEVMLDNNFDDPEDFFAKIPEYLRRGTDPRQKKYLEEICAVIERTA